MVCRVALAGIAVAALLAGPVRPAQAWGGGAFAFGAAAGITTGVLLSRPYAYPYGYVPYGYAYPAPVYAVPYGYAPAYPPVVYAPPPAYAAPPPAYAAPAATPAVRCGSGQFFNTLTGTCDRR